MDLIEWLRLHADIAERDVWAWTGVAGSGAPDSIGDAGMDAEMLDLEADERGAENGVGGMMRPIRRGDRIALYLRGIPQPEDIIEVVDDFGEITLPLIGTRRIEGMTSASAEKMLVRAFVEEGYYPEGKIMHLSQIFTTPILVLVVILLL